MSTQTRAFRPLAVSQATTLTGSSNLIVLNNTNGVRSVDVANTGAAIMFVRTGDATVTVSTTTGIPVFPNSRIVLTLTNDDTHLAVIGTATQVLITTVGEGKQ